MQLSDEAYLPTAVSAATEQRYVVGMMEPCSWNHPKRHSIITRQSASVAVHRVHFPAGLLRLRTILNHAVRAQGAMKGNKVLADF